MYNYDRRAAALAFAPVAYDYQRVMSALKRDIVQETIQMVKTVLKFASNAVRALTTNQSLKGLQEIKTIEPKLTALARWMISRHELEAEPVAQFAKLTHDLTEKTSFWNRPLFLNKSDHAEEVQVIVAKLQKLKTEIVKAFKQSGSWPATQAPV